MTIDSAAVADLVERGFHSVVFQPIRRLETDEILGFEGLMRGPAGTAIAHPGPLFQSTSLDRDLLHRVDLESLLAAVRLGRMFPDDVLLFVNMHGETLIRLASRRSDVQTLLGQLNIDLHRVVLEISELTDRSHVRAIARSLKPLRRAGVRIALDDVGARYAWLHHMLWLEPEILKIDRQFVCRIDKSARKRLVIRSLTEFCRSTGSEMIAEGIESAGERDMLIESGVSIGQGYFLGRPQPIQAWMPATEETAERARVSGLVSIGRTFA